MNKKGMGHMVWIIIEMAVAIVIMILVLLWFKGDLGKLSEGVVGGKIDDLGDWDNDKVANMYDKCPCQPGGNGKLEGCPIGVTEQQAQEEYKKYKEGKCEEYLAQVQAEK